MPRGWLNRRRILVVVIGMLLVSSLLPVSVARSIAIVPYTVVTAVLSPISRVLKTFADTLRPGCSLEIEAGTFNSLRADRDQALKTIQELELQIIDLRERLARLTESSVSESRQIEARVIWYSSDLANPVLRINKGSKEGVTPSLAVVWGVQLIGMVQNANRLSAEVSPITAPGTGMWVRVVPPDPNSTRRLADQLRLSDDGRSFYLDVARDAPLEIGDLAHLADGQGIWPPEASGFVVGKVQKISDHPERPLSLKRAIVQPLYDLPRLSRVAVLEPVN